MITYTLKVYNVILYLQNQKRNGYGCIIW